MHYKLELITNERNEIIGIVPQGIEKCPRCGNMGKVILKEITEHEYAGNFILECECGYTDFLQRFIGQICPDEYLDDFEGFIKALDL